MSRLLPWSLALVIIACCGEVASRLDDWTFLDIPFLANPDREYDLILNDTHCIRGRPHGRFKKYRLNEFGFRGPEFDKAKPPGTTRIMLLGASETFGLYESADHEYPALLRQMFAAKGDDVQIINAAIAGMTLPTLLENWKHWAQDFTPDFVVIYPSPQFYLSDEAPRADTPKPQTPPGFHSRFLGRLRDSAAQAPLLTALRVRYVLWRDLRNQDDDRIFHNVPEDRLKDFLKDIAALAEAVAASGARPVLVTHAFKTSSPPTPAETSELTAFRIFFPRAEPAVMPAFDAAANKVLLELGRERGWPVIDAAADLNGRTADFADPVHFNDAGSEAMAKILVRGLMPLLQAAKEAR